MAKNVIAAIYNGLVLLSPHIEVMMRKLYWKNISRLKSLNPHKAPNPVTSKHVDFEKIEDWLRAQGIKEGDLLIVHSSYGQLKCTGLTPDDIVGRLLALVGPTGTLCMPVIRGFKGEPKEGEWLTADLSDQVFTYKVKTTKVVSGLLPYGLMQHPDAVISRFPYNPLCAVGPLAKEMMAHNLDGEHPSPHGKNSAWKYCYDHGAKICFIGTTSAHHNTMLHVAEEAFGDWYWPDEEWYDIIKFNIIDGRETIYKEVYNRKAKWGMLHFAEMNLRHDLVNADLKRDDLIDGAIDVGYVDAQAVVDFLRSRNKKGYPYY